MPLYEFRCEQCGKIEELLVLGFGEDAVDEHCDECGGKMRRIFSATADVGRSLSESAAGSADGCVLSG